VLGRATGPTDTQKSPRPGLEGSHHLPHYGILYATPRSLHPNGSFSQDSRAEVPKSRPAGLIGLWSPITLRADLEWKCSLKQSCSSRREISNGIWHVVSSQVFRVDSWLFMVGSQTDNLTPGPSFGHNLCSNVQMSNASPFKTSTFLDLFNDIKNATNHWDLISQIGLWSFESPLGLHLPTWELPWECEGSLPHTFFHSQESMMWFLGSLLARTLTTPLPWSRTQS